MTATATDATHPTGMHSCLYLFWQDVTVFAVCLSVTPILFVFHERALVAEKTTVKSTEQINRFQQIFPELFIRSAEALNRGKSALLHSWGWVRSMPGMTPCTDPPFATRDNVRSLVPVGSSAQPYIRAKLRS